MLESILVKHLVAIRLEVNPNLFESSISRSWEKKLKRDQLGNLDSAGQASSLSTTELSASEILNFGAGLAKEASKVLRETSSSAERASAADSY